MRRSGPARGLSRKEETMNEEHDALANMLASAYDRHKSKREWEK